MMKMKWIFACLLLLCLCVNVSADKDHEGCFIKKKSEFLRFFSSVVSDFLSKDQECVESAVNNLKFFSDVSDALVLSADNSVKASMDSKRIRVDGYVIKAVAQARKKRGVVVLRRKKTGELRHYIFVSPIFKNSMDYLGCSLIEFSVKPCSH